MTVAKSNMEKSRETMFFNKRQSSSKPDFTINANMVKIFQNSNVKLKNNTRIASVKRLSPKPEYKRTFKSQESSRKASSPRKSSDSSLEQLQVFHCPPVAFKTEMRRRKR